MTTIRLRAPLDLITVVPFQLGFHPTRSLVLVGLSGHRVRVVQRVDLPAPADARKVADIVVDRAVSSGCDEAVVLIYEDARGEGASVARRVAAGLPAAGIAVLGHIVVRAGRAFSPGARPGEFEDGVPIPADQEVPAVADYVALGRHPFGSRAELAASLEPVPDALSAEVAAVRASRPGPDHAGAARGWGQMLDVRDERWFAPGAGGLPGAPVLAVMLTSLADWHFRDLVVAWLTPGSLPPEAFPAEVLALLAHFPAEPGRADRRSRPRRQVRSVGWTLVGIREVEREQRLVVRLTWLAQHAPPEDRAAALTVLASFAWHVGDGTLARLAVDAALAADPAYRLAQLLHQMVELGLRPTRRQRRRAG